MARRLVYVPSRAERLAKLTELRRWCRWCEDYFSIVRKHRCPRAESRGRQVERAVASSRAD